MSKVKVLGKKYGIEITRPWSSEMYDHNDEVADEMKKLIGESLQIMYALGMPDKLRELCKYICYYSMSDVYTDEEVYTEACTELERIANFSLNDIWPDLVEDGFVKDLETGFVGYDSK